MRKKKIQAVCMVTLMGLLLPAAWLLASLRAAVLGNFVVYMDDDQFDSTFEWLWIRPVDRIVAWGWKEPREDQPDQPVRN